MPKKQYYTFNKNAIVSIDGQPFDAEIIHERKRFERHWFQPSIEVEEFLVAFEYDEVELDYYSIDYTKRYATKWVKKTQVKDLRDNK